MNIWLWTLLLFLAAVVIAAVVGTKAKARFLILLRDQHPEIYSQLGSPPIFISTSLPRGIRTQRLIFSQKPELCREAEDARRHLRRVTVVVVGALFVETGLMMWAFNIAGY